MIPLPDSRTDYVREDIIRNLVIEVIETRKKKRGTPVSVILKHARWTSLLDAREKDEVFAEVMARMERLRVQSAERKTIERLRASQTIGKEQACRLFD